MVISDITGHFPIILSLDITNKYSISPHKSKVKILNEKTLHNLREHLKLNSLRSVYSHSDADMAYKTLVTAIINSMQCTIPEKTVAYCNKDRHPWLTKGILKSINQKNKLYKCYLKNPNNRNKKKYSLFRNKLTHLIRIRKRDHYTERFQSTKGDSKKTWKILNEVLGREHKGTVLPDTVRKDSNDLQKLTNHFNDHYVSLDENLASKIPQCQGTSYR